MFSDLPSSFKVIQVQYQSSFGAISINNQSEKMIVRSWSSFSAVSGQFQCIFSSVKGQFNWKINSSDKFIINNNDSHHYLLLFIRTYANLFFPISKWNRNSFEEQFRSSSSASVNWTAPGLKEMNQFESFKRQRLKNTKNSHQLKSR